MTLSADLDFAHNQLVGFVHFVCLCAARALFEIDENTQLKDNMLCCQRRAMI